MHTASKTVRVILCPRPRQYRKVTNPAAPDCMPCLQKGAVKKNCTNSHTEKETFFFVAVGVIFFNAPCTPQLG